MKILLDIIHPAHVHFFKHFYWIMQERGHELIVTSRDKDITHKLLDAYQIEHIALSTAKEGLFGLGKELIERDVALLKVARKFRPDVLMAIGNPSITHVATILRKKSIFFYDTEHANLINHASHPFASIICTPSCYKGNHGKKQIRYNGYHELAYLHPNYFKPNPSVLEAIDISKDETFTLLRFVSWKASHDVGYCGLTDETKRDAVKEFGKFGRVLISSEGKLPKDLEIYRISLPSEMMHDLMYYATLLYGESATMASECAVLGTHAIFCDFAGRGYTDEEERKYDLVYNFKLDEVSQEKSIERAVELLQDANLKEKGQKKREHLLNDKIDVSAFMVWFIENYPESIAITKNKALNFGAV